MPGRLMQFNNHHFPNFLEDCQNGEIFDDGDSDQDTISTVEGEPMLPDESEFFDEELQLNEIMSVSSTQNDDEGFFIKDDGELGPPVINAVYKNEEFSLAQMDEEKSELSALLPELKRGSSIQSSEEPRSPGPGQLADDGTSLKSEPLIYLHQFLSDNGILNKLRFRANAKPSKNATRMSGCVKVGDFSYSASCDITSTHFTYFKNKLALKLLLSLSRDYDEAWKLYSHINDKVSERMIKGKNLGITESERVEFKGDKLANSSMTLTTFQTKLDVVGENMCAFLNGGSEGDIYSGIHDTGVVQGIVIIPEQLDEILLKLTDKFKAKFEPWQSNLYKIEFLRVSVFKDRVFMPPTEPLDGLPSPPSCLAGEGHEACSAHIGVLNERLKFISEELTELRLETVVNCREPMRTPEPSSLYVLHVHCFEQAKTALFFYDGKAYVRSGPAKHKLTYAELIKRAAECYNAQQPPPTDV